MKAPLAQPAVPWIALWACLAGAVAPAHAAAQMFVGEVVEQGTGRPLAGAFVQLLDSTGVRVAGVLSNAGGEFAIRSPAPGRYGVVVELIGYAGLRERIELPASRTLRQTLEIPVEAISLGGVRAEVGERCHRRPGSSVATARLWDEARKALEVTQWAGEHRALLFQIVEHARELAVPSMEVLSESRSGRRTYSFESPYQSVPAERLHRGGYAQELPDGSWDYFAPDAQVLLSESFLDTHCFRVVPPPPAEPGLIGLGIEPVPERDLAEIEGVLWLEEGTAELRRLDFTYVNLPFYGSHWREVGGRVEFERLATGVWIVRRWHIRMPLKAVRRANSEVRLETLVEQGAEIRSVRTADGRRLAEAEGATLYGHAFDAAGEPLADATVAVPVADARTRTGPDGAYRLRGLSAGTWAVQVTHPRLTGGGLAPTRETVQLEAGLAARLDFRLDRAVDRALAACAAAGWPAEALERPVVVHGVVATAAGDPVPGAVVRARVRRWEIQTTADSAGSYVLCIEPTDRPVWVAALPDDGGLWADAAVVEASAREPGFVRVDVVAPRGARGPAEPRDSPSTSSPAGAG